MIERAFDVPFVAALAQREKQIQQSYRPVIGVHKWFARRPGSLFRSLLLAEFANGASLASNFFRSHNLNSLVVGDPFMGGGTPLLEANRLGAHVVGTDINPMAYWVVRQELGKLDRVAFRAAAEQVIAAVEADVGRFYQTTCTSCHNAASVKYFLWVKLQHCTACQQLFSLFSTYLLSKNERHPTYVLVCPGCGSLHEVASLQEVEGKSCGTCTTILSVKGPAQRNVCPCPHCAYPNRYPDTEAGVPQHRLFAIEYHCSTCKPTHKGRFFKVPDAADQQQVLDATRRLAESEPRWVPREAVPPGDESDRLHRWGYEYYHQLFNP
ncbi:MAG: DUF1156 domain-containing protein [Ardenticatenales bacterium]|nr:DUF1156 domain-containing protein [Ardenticatenales bacterium]